MSRNTDHKPKAKRDKANEIGAQSLISKTNASIIQFDDNVSKMGRVLNISVTSTCPTDNYVDASRKTVSGSIPETGETN